jgi:hypothetical protein
MNPKKKKLPPFLDGLQYSWQEMQCVFLASLIEIIYRSGFIGESKLKIVPCIENIINL